MIFIGGTTKVPDASEFEILITANTDPKEVDGTIEANIHMYTMSFDLLID